MVHLYCFETGLTVTLYVLHQAGTLFQLGIKIKKKFLPSFVLQVEKQLNSETLLQWTNPSTMANAKVKLSIPKFKVEKMIDAKASLENLGLKNIFNENTSDFSGMSETKRVALSNAIHCAQK